MGGSQARTRRILPTRSPWRRASRKGKVFIGNAGARISSVSADMSPHSTSTPARNSGGSTPFPAILQRDSRTRPWKPQPKPGPANGGSTAAADRCGTAWPTTRMRTLSTSDRQRLALASGPPPGERHSAPRQPLHRVDHCDQCRHRPAEVALPMHSRRSVGLRRDSAPDACRHSHQQPQSQSHHAGQQERIFLRHRSRELANSSLPERCRRSAGRAAWIRRAGRSSTRGLLLFGAGRHRLSGADAQHIADVFSPVTGLIYVPIAPSNTFTFTAAESMAADPGSNRTTAEVVEGGRLAQAGALRADKARSRWQSCARWNSHSVGSRHSEGTVVRPRRWSNRRWRADDRIESRDSNHTQGRLRAYTADKGEQLLDIALPLTSGVGPPMTYQLDGKQYIAVMAGTGNMGGRGGGGGGGGNRGNRGGNRGGAPQEPTAAAAAAANNVPPVPAPAGGAPPAAPAAPAPPAKPRLFVYALNAPGAQR